MWNYPDARHCAGTEMAEIMAYAAAVGSRAARDQVGAKGFIGNATEATAHYFGETGGKGTMPHALIGYAGSTLKAAEMYVDTYPDQPLTALVDYFGQEITDALTVCRRFPAMASEGRISIRLDTHGGRFVEGLDPQASYSVLERHAPQAIRRYRNDAELRYLTGTGVSAAAVFYLREHLDRNGFDASKHRLRRHFQTLQKSQTRRVFMNRTALGLAIAAAIFAGTLNNPAHAGSGHSHDQVAQSENKVSIGATKLNETLTMLSGVGGFSGGNVVVSNGPDGMLIIDDKLESMTIPTYVNACRRNKRLMPLKW